MKGAAPDPPFTSSPCARFDAALVGYLFGIVFAVFGVAYRSAVSLRRPPQRC